MTFTPARPFNPTPKPGGITFSSRLRGSDRAELFMSLPAQQEHFGESINGWDFLLMIGRGEDEGKLLLRPIAENEEIPSDAVRAHQSMKGSVRLVVAAWDLLGKETMKGAPCKALEFSDRGLLILLPDWCQPHERKARLERELGAKVRT